MSAAVPATARRGGGLRGAALIGALAVVWGLTYVAIAVALEDYEPGFLSWVRAVGGGAVILALWPRALVPALRLIRRRPLVALAFGAFNLALPFWLIAAGQQTVSAGVTAVLLATSPALVAIAAGAWDTSERLGARAWVGVVVATAGVALIVGASPDEVRSAGGALAILGAAATYAAGSLVAKAAPLGSPPEQVVVTLLVGSVLLALPGLSELPAEAPGLKATAALVALAVIGTAASLLLLFAAVRFGGAGYSLRPLYLCPAVSIAGGALLLDDPVGGGLVIGFLVAVTGVALITERSVREDREP